LQRDFKKQIHHAKKYVQIDKSSRFSYPNNQSLNSKVNRANAQSRPSGILCALAHGKLCFEYLKTFSAPENHLPLQGAKTPPKSAFFENT
jgi:hypothetical protein